MRRARTPRRRHWSNAGWRQGARIRSGCTWPISGHPVIGDPDYGQAFRTKANRLPEPLKTQVKSFPRQALHAGLLAFRHPATHMKLKFEAPLPGDIQELVGGFRNL